MSIWDVLHNTISQTMVLRVYIHNQDYCWQTCYTIYLRQQRNIWIHNFVK